MSSNLTKCYKYFFYRDLIITLGLIIAIVNNSTSLFRFSDLTRYFNIQRPNPILKVAVVST